jgi:hypothetical protein
MAERTVEVRKKFLKSATVVLGALSLASCNSAEMTATPTKTVTVTVGESQSPDADGGCEPFRVYAQNRWAPVGASERSEPDVLAIKTGGYAGNEVVAVDGWFDTDVPVYPSNSEPWDSDIWFRTTTGGWVAFAAVRSKPSVLDPTGLSSDGGIPVVLDPACEVDR